MCLCMCVLLVKCTQTIKSEVKKEDKNIGMEDRQHHTCTATTIVTTLIRITIYTFCEMKLSSGCTVHSRPHPRTLMHTHLPSTDNTIKATNLYRWNIFDTFVSFSFVMPFRLHGLKKKHIGTNDRIKKSNL